MWLLFSVLAILATTVNIYSFSRGKDYRFAMAAGLSFTALTLCAEINLLADSIAREDWSAASEVVNYQWALWFGTLVSIILNTLPLFIEQKGKSASRQSNLAE
ncbi:hypothetical protein CF394_08570 [Tetzosporium hominis]|uniref:MFS transporter n=1 Tax=Tetzosporium hominis TaxID=2020506 RepID=A0A264W2H6_9BACL|nr:hypothetical protein [Tetzosporium hominis]OZS77798.1 hypothetical protein CF394_08570 [Tetzosporium hominis]